MLKLCCKSLRKYGRQKEEDGRLKSGAMKSREAGRKEETITYRL